MSELDRIEGKLAEISSASGLSQVETEVMKLRRGGKDPLGSYENEQISVER